MQSQNLLDDDPEVGDDAFLVDRLYLVHGQREPLPECAEVALDQIRIHAARLAPFPEQQAEELVHPLNPRAALQGKLTDKFLQFGTDDGPYRLKVLGLVLDGLRVIRPARSGWIWSSAALARA